ncbi:MAG: hypothetical protein UX09_C0038G0007 [Candidatus Uhrbacteria bacterium GW2011_GWE2_45_35]|uniref:Myosin heavy chain n=2 Tax=Candidatus Uhriibacteriota TaxID=1752732 RepID=A0A0G1JBS8_9BACT|nr:MAG: hypothetical protein UW63_C0069G0001 [Candidatus Uhrbacteria bacterium GW2011_GWF2_44_350]KKU06915.1 MAG: hypothetical protein UX09_C0038G0007 [Candidatus Uhrbacteria bacterium GW2011_GWE2_45_35]HBR80883.1 hypothetical protein [Candidatus Uhrbacteria bacterium]HCU31413.1 hypothetical protein [Candidatus Uhrbacteria bacterium]
MTQTLLPLIKRTKQEIIEEYEKLQEKLEDLELTAKTVHSPASVELIEKAKTKSPQTIDKIFTDFQTALQIHLSEVRASLVEHSLSLQDMQKAVELSKEQLNLQYNIVLAADSLNQLVDEQTRRTATFETDFEQRKRQLDEEITLKKKTWDREAEEYEYHKKLKRERDQIETEEKEKTLAARETAIREQEQEIAQTKKTIEQFPKELEIAVNKRESDVSSKLTEQFAHEKALKEKETDAQIELLKLTVKNLEERLAGLIQEATVYKNQAEEANAKAQTLAIKAIERPTTVVAQQNPIPQQQNYHNQTQGRNNG